MTAASAGAGLAPTVLAPPRYWYVAGGCRSAIGTLDFGVHVALMPRGTRRSDAGASDRERQLTLTLRLQDGVC